jgi:hypothetical protein
MAARKATRKAAVKKKATKKKAAKKKATKKKAGKKRSAKRSAVDLIGDDLPKSLKAFGRLVRRDLTAIEKQIEVAGKDVRRSLSRVVRDASHQLGALEARGEREWRSLSRKAKGDVEQVMKRVRKATGV